MLDPDDPFAAPAPDPLADVPEQIKAATEVGLVRVVGDCLTVLVNRLEAARTLEPRLAMAHKQADDLRSSLGAVLDLLEHTGFQTTFVEDAHLLDTARAVYADTED